MEETKAKFINGRMIAALDFLELATLVGCRIAKNIATQINNKVEGIQIIHNNGASRISGYGLRTNTLLSISRVVCEVYAKAKAKST